MNSGNMKAHVDDYNTEIRAKRATSCIVQAW